jgi:DNA-binding MarR family transcriptional regulator
MKPASNSLKFILNLTRIQSLLHRRFDGGLGGLGLSEFMILYHLACAPDKKLRRIDLAGKVGLTASGVTRLLLPMEKIGLINKETNPNDARVSFVMLAPGGKLKLEDGLERAELLTEEIIPDDKKKRVNDLSTVLMELVGTII